jgi:hypothetical protein
MDEYPFVVSAELEPARIPRFQSIDETSDVLQVRAVWEKDFHLN